MILYYIIFNILKWVILLINGRPKIIGKENIPNKASILASTHRSWLDPIYLSILMLPSEIAYMAKHTLFEVKLFNYIFPKINVFPINRDKPSPTTLRNTVDIINKDKNHLGIFPSGSRYSTEIKSGTAFIQRLSKADIVPIAMQPPENFWKLLLRNKAKIAIGKPIKYNPEMKYSREELKEIDNQIAKAFSELDHLLDPEYTYVPKKKPD